MIDSPIHKGSVLVFTIHRVEPWWAEVGRNMGFEQSYTVSEIRGDGSFCLADDFYASYPARLKGVGPVYFNEDEMIDIIARCRLLRWLPEHQARAMILAMADAQLKVLEIVKPSLITAFPMDRYVSDVLERLSVARGIPFYELTASAVPGMSMLMIRGQLVTSSKLPDPELVEKVIDEIADPLFVPTYVEGVSNFTYRRWLKTFTYFRLRGWFFRVYSYLTRDPLSCHFLDAQSFLGHKPKLSDIQICSMPDKQWKSKMADFPKEKRLFMGLQIFPEASIDYWIKDRQLIEHDNLLERVARQFSSAGYCIAIKDHPLQFGFRRTDLIDRLLSIPNTIFIPYDVSGNVVLDHCGVNFTCTGTLGMQAALTGKVSIATPCYYTTQDDFVIFSGLNDVDTLVERVAKFQKPPLRESQRRIVSHLLQGSFESNFFSFKGFNRSAPVAAVAELGRAFGKFLHLL